MISKKIETRLGDTFNGLQFTVLVNAAPKNLTATEIRAEIRAGSQTGPVKKVLTVGSGFTKTNPAAGIFVWDAMDADFEEAGLYYWDIEFKDGNIKKTYIEGTWSVTQDTTKPTQV